MAVGLGVLRLEPRALWSMTPKELAAAVEAMSGVRGAPGPPSRADLAVLMRRFPDRA